MPNITGDFCTWNGHTGELRGNLSSRIKSSACTHITMDEHILFPKGSTRNKSARPPVLLSGLVDAVAHAMTVRYNVPVHVRRQRNGDAIDFASSAAWVGRGAADLFVPPSGQSCARHLVAGSGGTRSNARYKALAQHARYDPALRFGRSPFFACLAHALRASPLGAARHRMDSSLGRAQPASAADPPCSGNSPRRLALRFRTGLRKNSDFPDFEWHTGFATCAARAGLGAWLPRTLATFSPPRFHASREARVDRVAHWFAAAVGGRLHAHDADRGGGQRPASRP